MARGINPPWWWKPWITPLAALDAWWHRERPVREVSAGLAAIAIREALAAVDRGETVDLGDFTQYADDDD